MNRKEIDAMTDKELRIKAAELSGWRDCRHDVGPSDLAGNHSKFGRYSRRVLPDYLGYIADAWELTSKVPGCRWSVYELDEGGWAAVVMGKIEPINGRTTWDVVAESGPDTAPRAITKAFIMAMENDE